MENGSEYFRKKNQETPIVPVRLPSRAHRAQVKAAAAEAGITVSEWVRRAIFRELQELTTITPR